ncbi:hypothetical protein Ais01nite_76240 [Asanoa ishikariensis]|uniref:Uncharacterized protein n=1 Tax=Asanoa ishikariensis TaxID=137265 RepID=A0A1H3KZK6_9ACTN|nr:hypothetical protein Ais01nite_76240 [Asanoa ishikariensis]SDY57591.1 hypothetical protein SAMN05421684_0446 [Asanoa ishikariensis]
MTARLARRPEIAAKPRHHLSHASLLHYVDRPVKPADLDAIIVPTARPTVYLSYALRLAKEVGCPVLALCSFRANADEAYRAARRLGVQLIATDVHGGVALPELSTSALLASGRFRRRGDLSMKRNLGLALSKMLGWDRVAFLDDDISSVLPDDMRAAAGLLDRFSVVGLRNAGFPDNSVVCHALRAVGVKQGMFVGGGAMAVRASRTTTFFPDIYNEDWFFLLSEDGLSRVAVTGRMVQEAYEPFRTTARAREEELGDCLAEGIYALLDDGGKVDDANHDFWAAFLEDRRAMVDRIIAALPGRANLTGEEKRRIAEAMKASHGRRLFVTPDLCVSYLRALEADRTIWRDHVDRLPTDLKPRSALQHLGLTSSHVHRPR